MHQPPMQSARPMATTNLTNIPNSKYRNLDEKPGIFTFIGFGRKEGVDDRALSLQVYVTPELYENPRF